MPNREIWEGRLKELASKSSNPLVRGVTPKLVVKDKPGFNAHTGWHSIVISKDLLGVSPEIRDYILAHELGHIEGSHGYITTTITPLLPFGAFLGLALHFKLGISAVAAILWTTPFCIAGLIVAILYSKSMIFEFNADRRGARLIGTQEMVDGIKQLGTLKRSLDIYQSKIDHLSGKAISIFTRPPK